MRAVWSWSLTSFTVFLGLVFPETDPETRTKWFSKKHQQSHREERENGGEGGQKDTCMSQSVLPTPGPPSWRGNLGDGWENWGTPTFIPTPCWLRSTVRGCSMPRISGRPLMPAKKTPLGRVLGTDAWGKTSLACPIVELRGPGWGVNGSCSSSVVNDGPRQTEGATHPLLNCEEG